MIDVKIVYEIYRPKYIITKKSFCGLSHFDNQRLWATVGLIRKNLFEALFQKLETERSC